MKTTKHIWRTADGRLVPDGDSAAAFLAVPAGTEVAPEIVAMFERTADETRRAEEGREA